MSDGDAFTTESKVLAALDEQLKLTCDATGCELPAKYWLRFVHRSTAGAAPCFTVFGCESHTHDQLREFALVRRWAPALCTSHSLPTSVGGGPL